MNEDIKQPAPVETQGGSTELATKKKISQLSTFVSLFGTGGVILVAFVIGFSIAFSFIKHREPAPVTYAGGYNGGGQGCYLQDDAFTDTSAIMYGNNADEIGFSAAADEVVKRLGIPTGTKDYIKKIIETSSSNGINPAILISFWGAEQSFNLANSDKAFSCYIDGDKHVGFDQSMSCAIEFTLKPVLGKTYVANDIVDSAKYSSQVQLYSKIVTPDKKTNTPGLWDRLLYHYVAAAKKSNYDNFGFTTDDSDARIKFLKKLVPDQVTCKNAYEGALAVPALSQCNPDWGSKNPTGTSGEKLSVSICGSGCGLTTMAMLDRYFGGNDSPFDVGSKLPNPKNLDPSVYASISKKFKISSGSPIVRNDFPLGDIKKSLDKKLPVIWRINGATVDGKTIHGGPHWMLITGIGTNGEIIANDPSAGASNVYTYPSTTAFGTITSGPAKGYKFGFWFIDKAS